MAGRTFEVIDVAEILMHWHAGRSKNEMAQSLGVDRKPLRKYIAPAEAAGSRPGGVPKSEQEWAALERWDEAARLEPCQNPARSFDLLLYGRRSCSFASSISSWSGCSAGWCSWHGVTPPRTWRSWFCGMRLRSCVGRSRARGRIGLTVPYLPRCRGCCPVGCGCIGS